MRINSHQLPITLNSGLLWVLFSEVYTLIPVNLHKSRSYLDNHSSRTQHSSIKSSQQLTQNFFDASYALLQFYTTFALISSVRNVWNQLVANTVNAVIIYYWRFSVTRDYVVAFSLTQTSSYLVFNKPMNEMFEKEYKSFKFLFFCAKVRKRRVKDKKKNKRRVGWQNAIKPLKESTQQTTLKPSLIVAHQTLILFCVYILENILLVAYVSDTVINWKWHS